MHERRNGLTGAARDSQSSVTKHPGASQRGAGDKIPAGSNRDNENAPRRVMELREWEILLGYHFDF
jgi:hypothetical protein